MHNIKIVHNITKRINNDRFLFFSRSIFSNNSFSSSILSIEDPNALLKSTKETPRLNIAL